MKKTFAWTLVAATTFLFFRTVPAFAAEAVPDLPFSFDSPVIAPYWNRQLQKVEADTQIRELVARCIEDYRQDKSDWKIFNDAVYRSADGTLTYLDFQAEGVTDFRIVYVYSETKKQFIGKFPGSRA